MLTVIKSILWANRVNNVWKEEGGISARHEMRVGRWGGKSDVDSSKMMEMPWRHVNHWPPVTLSQGPRLACHNPCDVSVLGISRSTLCVLHAGRREAYWSHVEEYLPGLPDAWGPV